MPSSYANIGKLRKTIDAIDESILKALQKRQVAVCRIGSIKQNHGFQVIDEKRETELLANLMAKAEGMGMDKSFIKQIYGVILDHSKKVQEGQCSQKE